MTVSCYSNSDKMVKDSATYIFDLITVAVA